MSEDILTAGCLCGAVRYEITGAAVYADWCHCSNCRKFSGTGADPCMGYAPQHVRMLQGADNIRSYAVAGFATRAFCVTCGSRAAQVDTGGPVFMSMGIVDGDPGIRPVLRKQMAYAAPWDGVNDDLPRFDEFPTADDLEGLGFPVPKSYRDEPRAKPVAPRWHQEAPGPPVTGGCMCGGVRYEVTGPFQRANHCHCTRCQKHSSSFGLTQGRVDPEHFRLLQGEALLVNYTEEGRAAKVFCSVCGSSVFGGDWPNGKTVSIRFGSLDGDPGIRPQFHTFVGDKAAWYDITDDLPQFEGRATMADLVRLGITMP